MTGRRARRQAQPIQPFVASRYVNGAVRKVDLAGCHEALRMALTSPRIGDLDDADEPTRQAALRDLGAALRQPVPLLELAAALAAPWLVEQFGTAVPRPGEAPATTLDRLSANLVAIGGYLFVEPGALGYDPWAGLLEAAWANQQALAIAEVQRGLGPDRLRELGPAELQRTLRAIVVQKVGDAAGDNLAHLALTYAQTLARTILDLLDLEHAVPERIALLFGTVPQSDPARLIPPLGPRALVAGGAALTTVHDHLRLFPGAGYQAVREAIYKNTFGAQSGTPWPTALLALGDMRGQAQLRPYLADLPETLPASQLNAWVQAMWQQREELSDLDADVLDALSAFWIERARTVQDSVVADLNEFVQIRGLKPRSRGDTRSGYDTRQRAEILQAINRIGSLYLAIEIDQLDPALDPDLPPDAATRQLEGRAFVIGEMITVKDRAGRTLWVEKIRFRPSDIVAGVLLHGVGRQAALLSAQALRYDQHREQWEKRLARYFSWRWTPIAGGEMQRHAIRDLLDAVGKDLDSHRPQRTRERLEAALARLQADGVIGDWAYAGWAEEWAAEHGWARRWLATTVTIAPPEAVRSFFLAEIDANAAPWLLPGEPPSSAPAAPIEATVTMKPAPPSPPVRLMLPESPRELGHLLKDERRRRGQNQGDAARDVGITQGYWSRLENGTLKTITPELRERLARWCTMPRAG